MTNIKRRIKDGEAVHGCWLNLGSSATAEIFGLAGFDWVLIDLEHGIGAEKDILPQMQALANSGAAAIVRVESGNSERIHRVLDLGAEGVMVPRVETDAEAEAIIKAMRYPPQGTRGVAKMVRATGFGKNADDYIKNAGDNILGVIQIETKEALNHLDAIAAIDGVDVLFIGPSDLSMSLGIFGQFNNRVYIDAVKAIARAAEKAGKAAGILIFNPDDYTKYYNMGLRFIACGADGTFVSDAARNVVARLGDAREALSKK